MANSDLINSQIVAEIFDYLIEGNKYNIIGAVAEDMLEKIKERFFRDDFNYNFEQICFFSTIKNKNYILTALELRPNLFLEVKSQENMNILEYAIENNIVAIINFIDMQEKAKIWFKEDISLLIIQDKARYKSSKIFNFAPPQTPNINYLSNYTPIFADNNNNSDNSEMMIDDIDEVSITPHPTPSNKNNDSKENKDFSK